MKNNLKSKNKYMEQVVGYLNESKKLKSKYNIAEMPIVNFPKKHKVPILAKIALWVLRKQGGTLDMNYKILKNK